MHSNLFICLRERISYDYAKANYKNVYLFPDMALRLSMKSYDYERIGCLICLRHDIEGTLSKNDTDKLMTNMRQLFADRIDITDMCEEKNFDVKCRSEIIDKKMCEFAKHELVVTDRLHGMIFAAITGTPCIVVDSKSVKLRGCYEWISDLEYIKFCDDLNCIEPFFNSVKDKKFIFDNSKLLPLYEPLVKIIKD